MAGAAGRAAGGRPAPQPTGAMMIRGRAGPHLVEIRGFAPGTTAADIEEAMRTKGISIHSCRLLQTSPKVTADVLCDSKEDADRVGEFHQQWVGLGIPVCLAQDATVWLTHSCRRTMMLVLARASSYSS